MHELESHIEYLNKVGHKKVFEELKRDWDTKKSQKPSKLDYVVDEWFKTLKIYLKMISSDNENEALVGVYRFSEWSLKIKKLAIGKDIKFNDIIVHDPDAIKYVLTHDHDLSDCEYWKHISDLYIHLNRQFELLPLLKAVFTATNRKDKDCLMTKEDIKYLESLPDEIEIHRGMTVRESKNKEYGLSWSLDKKVAEFFAFEHPDNQFHDEEKTVVSLKIPKKEVIAYLSGRQEEEIIWVSKN